MANEYIALSLAGLVLVEMVWIYRGLVEDIRALWSKDSGP